MTTAISPFSRDPSFDPFLFAAIGEERNGMLLSVVSALARLDLDPWFEAASLSRLSAPAAMDRLTSLLSPSPSSMMKPPAHATIARLIGLLPKPAENESWSPSAVVTLSKMYWPMAVYFILTLAMMCAAHFAERRDPPASTGVGVSTAAGVSEPSAAKGRSD